MLIKCFQQRESVNLVQLLDDNAIIPQNLDLKDTISLANGELQNLKAMTSDVYAEQCGNKCFAQ